MTDYNTLKRTNEELDVTEAKESIKKNKISPFNSKSHNKIDAETGLSNCFHRIRTKLYLSLAPCYLKNPIQGIKQQHLDSMIMTYNSNLKGIILTYFNIKLSKQNKDIENDRLIAKVSDDNPFSFIWCYIDFLIWKPEVGDIIEGYSIMQSQSHIGLLINDTFNATIKKFNIPNEWYFIPNQEDEGEEVEKMNKSLGNWYDSNGNLIDGKLSFTIKSINISGKFISIDGTLLTPNNEIDSQPVVLDNKHMKFDDGNIDVDGTNNEVIDVKIDNEINGDKTDDIRVDESSEDEDLPKYNDSESERDSDSSSDSDSDSSDGSDGSDGSDSNKDSETKEDEEDTD